MDSPNGFRPSFSFGPYEADLPAGELRKNGSRIKIQDLPLRLLSVLARQTRLWISKTG
jgi:DNA-binding winged helix-turn-helix (wHTH) protein